MFHISITALSQVFVFCHLTTIVTQTLKFFACREIITRGIIVQHDADQSKKRSIFKPTKPIL